MPAVTEKQRKMMAIAEHHPSKLFKRNKGVLKMGKAKLSEFASKAKSDLPRHKNMIKSLLEGGVEGIKGLLKRRKK